MSPYGPRSASPRLPRAPSRDPGLPSILLGTGGFLLAVAASLYLVAALAP